MTCPHTLRDGSYTMVVTSTLSQCGLCERDSLRVERDHYKSIAEAGVVVVDFEAMREHIAAITVLWEQATADRERLTGERDEFAAILSKTISNGLIIESMTAEKIAAFVLSDPHHRCNLTDPNCPIGAALTELAAAIRAGQYRPDQEGCET